jgi:L-lactate dehydrogenase (cytochrome)
VLKALCLGARAVGLGRAFLYAQGVRIGTSHYLRGFEPVDKAYGSAGVSWIIRILEQEIVTGMGQLGVRAIRDLTPEMVSSYSSLAISLRPLLLQVERVDWQPLTGKL